MIFAYTQPNRSTLLSAAVGLSTGVAFLQFCAIIVYSIVAPRARCSCLQQQSVAGGYSNITQESLPAVINNHSVSFRDSMILEESQELPADKPTY